jgi:hypothetical protein
MTVIFYAEGTVYVKLFSSLLTSSVWAEDNATRIVWISMLCLADKDGDVRASPAGLARIANVSVEECQRALAVLLSPDAQSTTPDDDGRRIEQRQGGWHILNYVRYRQLRDEETRKQQWREAASRARAKKRDVSNSHQKSSTSHRESAARHSESAHTDTDTETDTETTTALVADATDTSKTDPFVEAWAAYPKRLGANPRKPAFAAFWARVKGGVAPRTLLDATRAYAAFCAATQKAGTEFVMQGQRFYGPDGGWREDWSAGPPKAVRPNDPATGRSALQSSRHPPSGP